MSQEARLVRIMESLANITALEGQDLIDKLMLIITEMIELDRRLTAVADQEEVGFGRLTDD